MDKSKIKKEELEKKGRLNVVEPLEAKHSVKTPECTNEGDFVGIYVGDAPEIFDSDGDFVGYNTSSIDGRMSSQKLKEKNERKR